MKFTYTKKSAAVLSPKIKLRLSAAASILGVMIFALAYFSMKNHVLLDNLNQPVLSLILANRNNTLVDFAKFITSLASPPVIVIAVATIASLWFIVKKEIWRPILLIMSILASTVTSLSLKGFIKDIRPPQIDMIPAFETDYSFPSGHTLSMAVLLLVVGYLVYSRSYSKSKLISWTFSAIIGSGLVAMSRLYLGYHWLTDITASLGLGLIILSIVILTDKIASRSADLQ